MTGDAYCECMDLLVRDCAQTRGGVSPESFPGFHGLDGQVVDFSHAPRAAAHPGLLGEADGD